MDRISACARLDQLRKLEEQAEKQGFRAQSLEKWQQAADSIGKAHDAVIQAEREVAEAVG